MSAGGSPELAVVAVLVVAAAIYLVCTAQPVWIFTLAIVLSPLSGNWKYMGIPGPLSPDRLLFVIGIVVVLFRVYVSGNLPRPRFRGAHVVMALALLFAAGSAIASHSLLQKGPGLLLLETFGVLPFMTFWLGPVVFPTARERSILLAALVILGGYLGLTTLFETLHLDALVWPRYILNPAVGLQYGRARGPFADAVANGVGLYVGAVAGAIAVRQWRRQGWRVLAGLIAALCLVGTIMTLERSVWIAAGAATVVALVSARGTRRLALPLLAGIAAAAALTIFAVPGLHGNVSQRLRSSDSIYDRQNVERTALNMLEARPLAGFGWGQYQAAHLPYIQESPNIPLTGTNIDPHSVYLEYAAELGLIGSSLWLLAVLLGAGGTTFVRAPAELEPWRQGLVALAVFFLIGEAAVPPTVFVNASLWLWAGVVAVVRYAPLPAVERVRAGVRGRTRTRTSYRSRGAAASAAPPGISRGST